MAISTSSPRHIEVRPEWLALRIEEALEPDLPIIDAHHHFHDRPTNRYLLEDLTADMLGGHNVRATVYVQSTGMNYRTSGDPNFASVGEAEFAGGVAAQCAKGPVRVCAGIVGYADLALGGRVKPILEALLEAGGGYFRSIRDSLVWDEYGHLNARGTARQGRMRNPLFREGFACLAPLGIAFDAWVYHPQLDELADFANAFPATSFVLNHLGGPVHIAAYAGRRDAIFAEWSAAMRRLAGCPNVTVKLGGIGMNYGGFGFHELDVPPSSQMLCDAWRPYIETCIEAFGVQRCMFESNFPVDKGVCSYTVVWNAFKRMVSGASTAEKAALFSGTAARVYRLAL